MSNPQLRPFSQRFRARGAVSNAEGRFERYNYAPTDDAIYDLPDPAAVETIVSMEQAKSLITYNKSPDLPFDRSINPYRGCEHGCIYCFARPSHAYLGYSAGLDFETQLIARPNAPDVLARELRSKSYRVAPIAIGTNTDPYQPIERDHGIMRACLQVLSDFNHPVAIVTKGTLIERDIDILSDMARRGLVRVGVSVTTLDPDLSRKMEPRVPVPARRLTTIARLAEAGITVRVMASPMIPALTDPELEAIISAGHAAGARFASWIMLRLPREVSPLFREWLGEHYPNRLSRVMGHVRDMHGGDDYSSDWFRRMRGVGPYADLVAQRFNRIVKKLGMNTAETNLRTDLFKAQPRSGDQLSLF